ncbi:hypothetical protein TTHERM_000323149 (macronuclear) [Tetrahymena thermophila SB210]|uniref:EGF-like domain-containing protein n=1 Tax=Tetrahymena thermophila (strain SB210) TaxID=312017 RepID=W7XCH6_TETTS|nr:hypothetical protein TTHERM_000323149 [Tetrahymena thermophila SB210]EWS75157.1 hypothetical protein TTHERM_000323149 [Tetrahymena thermophila SB210]|eukprot:XP_012652313.1 hypothetical protein TTHERM_000323149 [Tetrahymena thermophila SB210]
MCDKYAVTRVKEVPCRLCVYNNVKKGNRPNGECQKLPDGQIYNVWGQIVGCDSSKCKCDNDNMICNECLDSSYFIYPDFQTCEPICRQGRWAKGRICLKCNPDGYYMNDSDNICMECNKFPNCNECSSVKCEKCQDGFGFNFFSQKNCIQCSNGYVKIGDFCVKQPKGCKKISLNMEQNAIVCDECQEADMIKINDGSCEKCSPSTYYDSKSQSCKSCSLKNCEYCPQNKCQSCAKDLELIDGQCQQPLSNCAKTSKDRKYVDQGVCKVCPDQNYYNEDCTNFNNFCGQCLPCQLENQTQFIDSGGNCLNCGPSCKTCKNQSNCIECLQPGLKPNKDGICKCEDITKCLFCDDEWGCFKCPEDAIYDKYSKGCERGKKPCSKTFKSKKDKNGNLNCYCQSQNCKYCNYEDGNSCLICNYNFELKNGQCIQCPVGYQYDKFNQKCVCAVNNCNQCSQNNGLICDKCKDQYELTEEGFCKACSQNYIYDSDKQKCICQDKNCIQCSKNDGSICLNCAPNFQLDISTSVCKEQPDCKVQYCFICQNNSTSVCQTCQEGFKLDNTGQNCIIALENCLELEEGNKSKCKVCIDSFIPNLQGKCKCLFDNCKNCTINNKICSQCEEGYSWQDNQCKCSIPNCLSCDISPNYGKCQKCLNNYKLISNINCICSDENCKICSPTDGSICQQCQSGYILDQTTKKCNQCQISNCLQCQNNDGNKCEVCQDGYEIDQTNFTCKIKIQFCIELNILDKSKCEKCQQNYIQSVDKTKCECQFQNCQSCQVVNSKCAQCENGFTWSDLKVNCDCNLNNCSECQTKPYGTCKTCNNGYLMTKEGKCECSVQNCQQCNKDDGKVCDNCIEKYVLDLNKSQCNLCSVDNCLKCKNYQPNQCQICEEGYEIDTNSLTCKIKIKFCVELNASDKSKCEKCQQNYIQSTDKSTCECKFSDCNSCQVENLKCIQCENGFIWNNLKSQCECNLNNCQECQTSPYGICKACRNGYLMTKEGKCECSVLNCQQCNKDDGKICDKCIEKYVLDSSKSLCNLCSVNNCLTCKDSQPSKCELCENGYKKDSNEQCQINIDKCIKLNKSDYTVCDQCESNYQFNSISKQCECKVQNCFQCQIDSITNICKQCQAGFIWDSSQSQCICNIVSCQECSTEDYGACKKCNEGFMQKDRDQCVCSISNCEKCDQLNGNVCLECEKGFVQSQTKDQCKKCEVINCLECVSQNEKFCKQCKSGFSIQNSGAECKIELQNCIELDPSSPQKCKKCDKNYVIDENFNCKCSIDNCKDCQIQPDGTCSQCQKGFKAQQDKCICNIPNCKECDTQYYGKCQTCKTNYLKSANGESCDCQVSNCSVCTQDDGKICDQCQPDFIFRNSEKKECWKCQVENCSKCQLDNAMICQQCKDGYKQLLKDPAQCEIAIKNCVQLDTTDSSKCQKCSDNYKVDENGQCTCKIQFCIECNLQNQSVCLKCQDGFTQKAPNSNCECNLENCLECDYAIFGTCKQCIQGYQINSNKNGCECNVQNCSQCNPKNGQLCDVCEQKHVLNEQKNKCELCQVQNCDKCIDGDKNKCQSCSSGFKLSQSGQCEIGIEKCVELNATEKNKCNKCEENYTFNNDAFQPKCICQWENCKNCKADQQDSAKCETCQEGHIWNSVQKKCVCNIQNCSICNQNDYGKCSQCKNNFIMQDSNRLCSCQAQNCDKCSEGDGQICVQCKENYILDNSSQQCLKCQVNNCQECLNNSAYKCKQCKKSFQIDQNDQCIEEKAECKVANCEKCENQNQNNCSQCKTGYKPSISNGINTCMPAIDNCIELNKSNIAKCEKCSQQYQLDPSQSKCILECNLKRCKKCDNTNNKICIECDDNFILDKSNNSCEPCKIENCKICSQKQLGSCQECELGFTLFADQNNKNLCKQIKQQQTFTLKQNCTSKGYQIYINFEKEIQFLNSNPTHSELSQIFNFTIGSKQNFTYTYSVRSKNEILLEIETEEDWIKETLQLQVQDNQFIENNKLSKQNDSVDLINNKKKDDNTSTNGTKEAVKAINKVAQSAAFPLALFGDFFKVFSIVDVTNYIYFLFYVNVDHPYNIQEFSKLFGSFQFQYIPNYIMPNFDNDHIIKSPEKFMNNNIDSFFLKNSSHSYSFLIIFLCVYIFFKVISLLPLGRVQNIVKRSIKQEWEFNSFIYAAWIVFTYLSVACTLQVRSYKMIDDLSRASYSFFIITSIVLLSLPFIFFYLIFSRHQDLQLPRNQRKRRIAFSCIVRGLKINTSNTIYPETVIPQSLPQQDPQSLKDLDLKSEKPSSLVIDGAKSSQLLDYVSVDSTENKMSQSELDEKQRIKSLYNPLCKYTNVLLFIRKIMFSLIIVMLHDQTYVQISLLSTLNVLLALFFVICKPYIRKIDNINHFLTEIFLLILQVISAYLKNYPDSQSSDDRIKLGWVYVAICLLLLLMHSLILIIDTAKSAIRFIKNLKKSSKIVPTNLGDVEAKKQVSNKIISAQIIDNKPSSILTFEGAPQSVEKALNQNEQKVEEDQFNDIEKKRGMRRPRTKFFKRNPFLPKDQQQSFINLDNPESKQNSNNHLSIQKIINIGSTNISFNNDASPVKLINKNASSSSPQS